MRKVLLIGLFVVAMATVGSGQTVLWVSGGAGTGSAYGDRLRRYADLDANGTDELAIGEPLHDPGGAPSTGRVCLVTGATGILISTIDAGATPGSRFGAILGPPADWNGDGIAELFVTGAPLPAGPPVVFVVSPANALLASYPGWVGSAAGDLDGNTLVDPLIGDPFWSSERGRIAAYADGTGTILLSDQGFSDNERLGASLAVSSTSGGAGCTWFAAGSAGDACSPHAAVRYYCNSTFPLTPSWIWTGSACGGTLMGVEIANAGDVDGDGAEDVVVGAPFECAGACCTGACGPYADGAGKTYVLSGFDGGILHAVAGSNRNAFLGRSVGGSGDLDGDGFADFVVGAPALNPANFPWGGGVAGPTAGTGRCFVFSGATGGTLAALSGASPGRGFGAAVEGLGDVTSDEYPDIAVGEPYGPAGGKVWAFSLAPSGVALYGQGCASSGSAPMRIAAWPEASLGSVVAVNLSRAPVAIPALVAMGWSNTSWSGLNLPLDLGFLGLAGCSLLTAPDLVLAVALAPSGQGGAHGSLAMSVPGDAALVGVTTYFQAIQVQGTPAGLQAAMSRGLAVTVHP